MLNVAQLSINVFIFVYMTKLFIVGIPRDMEESELTELFSAYGQVNAITIITGKLSGESQGYGFITMTDKAGADRAIAAMDGGIIDERTISVRIADDKRETAEKVFTTKSPGPPVTPKFVKVEKTTFTTKRKRPRIPC
jgi:RNA recognition motif-containing protein